MCGMTGEYDMLMSIYDMAKENQELRSIAEWLFNICIDKANKAKRGWNFEVWKQREVIKYSDSFEEKARFLNECHDVLAHRGINAFDIYISNLISAVFNAFRGKDVIGVDKLKKRFPELPEKLKQLGYKPLDKKGWMWTKS